MRVNNFTYLLHGEDAPLVSPNATLQATPTHQNPNKNIIYRDLKTLVAQ